MAEKGRVIDEWFSQLEIEVEPYQRELLLDMLVQQTLSRNMGYHEASQRFLFLRVNGDGQLSVTTEAPTINSASTSQVAVATSATKILDDNPNRKSLTIYNPNTISLFIGFTSSVGLATGFELAPNSYWTNNDYFGEIWGIYQYAVTRVVSTMEFS